MKKVLLLNLPSATPCYRILHRAKIGEPNYVWPLVDFIYLSGWLHEAGYELAHKDFQADKRDSLDDYLAAGRFDIIAAAYCPFSEGEDLDALRRIKERFPATQIILLANHNDRLHSGHAAEVLEKSPFVSGLVHDYAYNGLAAFLAGERGDKAFNVLWLEGGALKGSCRSLPADLEIPLPRHELFSSKGYFHYDGAGGALTTAMGSFGCKMGCAFCWGPQLYEKVVTRSPESMLAEMRHLHACGVREVYFHDYSFAWDREKTLKFCRLLAASGLGLRWYCSSRFDLMTPELIEAMAAAGCKCIEFGLESGNYEVRKLYGKNFPDSKVLEVAALCRRHGVHTTVFLILGLPEESAADMERSVEFAIAAGLDYIALNILWVEPETDIAARVEGKVEAVPSEEAMMRINFRHPTVSVDEVAALKKRYMRRIYLNPAFILRQFLAIRSFKKFRLLVSQALKIISRNSG